MREKMQRLETADEEDKNISKSREKSKAIGSRSRDIGPDVLQVAYRIRRFEY